jgi:hypothetical protein
MSFTITQIKSHLIGMGHGSTLNKVRNIEAMFERVAAKFFLRVKTLEMIRTAALSNLVHDDVYTYTLASDFGALIDLFPQEDRQLWDKAVRNLAGQFDIEKAIKNRTISIEGSEGTKIIRINWRARAGRVLHNMNSISDNGTWSAVTGASGVALDTIFKKSGSGSISFDLAATGGGIKNSTMSPVDMTNEDEVADIFVWVYLPSTSITSIAAIFGNDLTTNYWTPTAQTTQADGTSLKVGWNLIKFSWSGATESGTVDPTTIDSFQLTINGSTAINNIRVDNIIFSIGRNFDMKYYSKYLFKNTSGTYISQPASDDDSVLVDNDSLPLFLYELLKEMAHQMEGTDSAFDINYAEKELQDLFPNYRALNPGMAQRAVGRYGNSPGRGRW